ncbi:uncharacterized protein MEPE_02607 [Melanopsichium pennsylvanicum]|uniref:BHLH domain-containing protein n=2 Tax=Melanopsichium pennsylvanicum TaxID=63383 RepID=A0AAJ4XKA3_9BASI|nr:transcription factor [Melanopsichium pennsylvanicum 4]SNX83899.1 uncharacterized protein MEPE_02607 [Melanopsichium pennsylvanicum]
MFPGRTSEGVRNTLPPISSISHDAEFTRDSAAPNRALRAPLLKPDSVLQDRRPSSALDRRRTPPGGLLPRPHSEKDPPRPSQDAHPGPMNPKFSQNGPPPPPFRRDGRGSPASDEHPWRSYDRPDSRFAAKAGFSPRMPPSPYTARDDSVSAPWQRVCDDQHRSRMPAPTAVMRDEGPWRSSSTLRDRADVHPDAFAHERAREEERWREERDGRPLHPFETAPGYPSRGPYAADVRSGVHPLDAEQDSRRTRRRATSSLVEEEQNAQRYAMPGARPYGSGTYSPPESRSQSVASNQPTRPGIMAGMDPSRPASTLGVVPNAATPSAAPAQPPATNTINANRRVAHLLSEQKRRESINTGFEDLRQAIPACRDGQDSKATILKRALEYIRELEAVVERQHRPALESHARGGYSNRSPPDDKDDIRRFGRPGGDEERRGGGTQAAGSSSSSSEAGSGPRIGGLPYNAFSEAGNGCSSQHALHHVRGYPQRHCSPNLPLVTTHHASMADLGRPGPMKGVNSTGAKRWAEDTSDEGQRSPSHRRVSDGDKDDDDRSPPGANYMITPAAHSRSSLTCLPALDQPRDWHSRLDNKSLVDSAVRA